MEKGGDVLELRIQSDTKGKEGDVRDILIVRHNIQWEIGLSLKHNHFAVKHSRLSQKLDFGAKWYGIPCSQKYWEDVRPVFTYLVQEKTKTHCLTICLTKKMMFIYHYCKLLLLK